MAKVCFQVYEPGKCWKNSKWMKNSNALIENRTDRNFLRGGGSFELKKKSTCFWFVSLLLFAAIYRHKLTIIICTRFVFCKFSRFADFYVAAQAGKNIVFLLYWFKLN